MGDPSRAKGRTRQISHKFDQSPSVLVARRSSVRLIIFSTIIAVTVRPKGWAIFQDWYHRRLLRTSFRDFLLGVYGHSPDERVVLA
jgi:hypothetical protein